MPTPEYKAKAFPSENREGMDLRDWFAGQALAGIMAHKQRSILQEIDCGWYAEKSYKMADAMIEARKAGR